MTQVSVKDQIKKIVDIQAIDAQIYLHKSELEEKPAYIENLKRKFEENKTGLRTLEDNLKSLQVERKSKELELSSKEGEITKASGQLMLLKTNKEYHAKQLEIENLKVDKSKIEEQILISYDESDSLSASIAKERDFLAQEEKRYLAEKKSVDDSIAEIEEKLKILEMKRSQIAPEIDKTHLSRYERILENKKGLAIVPVKGNSCGGCFMNVPEQVINEIQMHDRLIQCEMCARILYLEDDL